MIGAPCASSAQTKCTSAPRIRWKRTQTSAWMYSMMWPMWNGPFAYGKAVVTNSVRRAAGIEDLAGSGDAVDSSKASAFASGDGPGDRLE